MGVRTAVCVRVLYFQYLDSYIPGGSVQKDGANLISGFINLPKIGAIKGNSGRVCSSAH